MVTRLLKNLSAAPLSYLIIYRENFNKDGNPFYLHACDSIKNKKSLTKKKSFVSLYT